jgi:hypothetical protein
MLSQTMMEGTSVPDLPWRVVVPMSEMNVTEFTYWKEQQRQRHVIEARAPMSQT